MPNLKLKHVQDNPPGTDGKTYLKDCYFEPAAGTGYNYNFCNKQGIVLAYVSGAAGSQFSFGPYPPPPNPNGWTWTITIGPAGLSPTAGGSGAWTNNDPTPTGEESGTWQATASGTLPKPRRATKSKGTKKATSKGAKKSKK